ncbi:MAG: hypothetical protein ACK4WK_05570, partial [Anaerolineae bacterium]
AMGGAVLWVLLDILNLELPWLPRFLPQALLFVLGWLAMYLHRVLEEIRRYTVERSAEVVIGNDAIYQAATRLVRNSPPRARLWATSLWLYATLGKEAPGFDPYFKTILSRLEQDREAQYLRAVRAVGRKEWENLRRRTQELLPHPNAMVRFYRENPLALDCLIGEHEALIGFPDRATYPHLGVAVLIRNPDAVESLRQWYRDFIWEAPVVKQDIRREADLEELDREFGLKD